MTFEALHTQRGARHNSIVKTCSKCSSAKPLSDFYKDKRASDGLYSHCKICHQKVLRTYSRAHPEVARAGTARYRAKNPGAGKESNRLWRSENRVKVRANQQKYARRNPEKIRELVIRSTAKRKARKLNATPAWADEAAIKRIYLEARAVTSATGIEHHVDHIVPLISSLVCGMHVQSNLQVVTGSENTAKSNRYWPDMP